MKGLVELAGTLSFLLMMLSPILALGFSVFLAWVIITITLSLRGIRRELARMNDLAERAGVVAHPTSVHTRTGPLGI